jgi:dTDP-4-dehydrorhamnose reductase
MKCLLLGANGQLGSDFLKANSADGQITITSLTRNELDVSNIANIKPTLLQYDFDVLINCVSYTNTEAAEKDPALAFILNAHSVKEMAQACAQKNARLVQISTDYVFGQNFAAKPLLETDCPFPVNVYGASKLMGEAFVQMFCQDYLIFRVASLFGLGGKGNNFVEKIYAHATNTKTIRVVDDQVMSPTSSIDVAKIILQAIALKAKTGIYHGVNSGATTWYDFAKSIVANAKLSAEVIPVKSTEFPSAIVRPTYSALDNSKLAQIVGPIAHWEVALQNYFKTRPQA